MRAAAAGVAAAGGRRLAAADRRAQLLDAALELAAGGDVAAISVADLAAAAGVSQGLLYHYFPTKGALVVAAVRRAAEALLDDLEAAAGGPPAAALLAGLAAYLDHVQAQPTGWRALLAATSGELAEISAEVEARSRRLVLGVLGIEEPGPVLVAALDGWLALERRACATWLEHPGAPRAGIEAVLAATFFAALEAAAGSDPGAAAALARLG